MEMWIFVLVLSIAIAFNILTSLYIAKYTNFKRYQKIILGALVWLFPLSGSIGVFLFIVIHKYFTSKKRLIGTTL
jgi:hypothetical protein